MSTSAEETRAARIGEQYPVPDHLAKYATPLHVYREDLALADAAELRDGLLKYLPRAELYYSVKTNPLTPLLRALTAQGWGLEVVGGENVRAARESGCPGERWLFNGAAWDRDELGTAVYKHGVRRFTVDSLPMAELLGAVIAQSKEIFEVAFRVHDGDSHFGLTPDAELIKATARAFPKQTVFGLHIHVNPHGSAPDAQEIANDFRARARKLKALSSQLKNISYFDLGGGFDSPHVFRPHPRDLGRFHNPNEVTQLRAQANPQRFSLREVGEAVALAVAEELRGERIFFEPGRAVCTRALDTLIGVRAVKENFYPEKQVVITDGNTAFLGPLHRAVHPVYPSGTEVSFVYGALPHSGDWLFQNLGLPKLQEGARLLIQHTGAYFLALEAQFGHALPKIVHADRNEFIPR